MRAKVKKIYLEKYYSFIDILYKEILKKNLNVTKVSIITDIGREAIDKGFYKESFFTLPVFLQVADKLGFTLELKRRDER